MSEFRRYPKSKTRQIADYNEIISKIGQSGIYCIDNGIMSLCRILVGSRGLWRTSYAVDYGLGGYNIPDNLEFEPIYNAIHEFLDTGSTDMSCDLREGLDVIADRIAELTDVNASCCGGSGGTGSGGISPDVPANSYIDDDVTPPAGFSDYPAYSQHKCDAAHHYVNSVIDDLQYLLVADAAALTIGILGTALIVPGVNLVALLGLITVLVAQGVLAVTLQNVVDWYTDELDNLVCVVYSASSAGDAYTDLLSEISASSLSSFEEQLAAMFISQGAINQAYELANIPNVGNDCTSCEPSVLFGVTYGTLIASAPNQRDVQSVNHPTLGGAIKYVACTFDPPPTSLTASVLSGVVTNGAQDNAFRAYDSTSQIYSDNDPYTSLGNVAGDEILTDTTDGGTTSFVIRYDWTV